MKKILKVLVINFLIFAPILAQNSSGLTFLKIGSGAQNIALGDLGVTSKNISGSYYNPALLIFEETKGAALTHTSQLLDLSTNLLNINFKYWDLDFGFNVNTTSVSDIPVRNIPGEPISTFNANYFSAGIATAFNMAENITFGLGTKFLYENLYRDEASGWGFDFGVIYHSIFDGVSLNASLRNLGSMSELRNEATSLPTDLRIGTEYGISVEEIDSEITLLGGFQKYTSEEDNHFHLGTQIYYKSIIALRFGYVTGYESKSISLGFGVDWEGLAFDYAHIPFDFNLGDSHTISLSYKFN
ncbi:MAG: PorV/PorQ family protein [Melioribacteraceae bacterium]|nr:PorV/PorQ family protein [Melioribacteraceae bacterium]